MDYSRPSDRMHLALHGERDTYTIGEPIRPRLQAVNNTARVAELGRHFAFDWERLAFAEPDFVHLVGPGDTELLLPYRRDPAYFDPVAPIAVAVGGEAWQYLPLYAHVHLREPGEYSFWLDLGDDLGRVHESNKVGFRLAESEASAPPELLGLTLRSHKSSFAPTEPIDLEAAFANGSGRPLTFLRPQEDSLYGWVNPVYQFTVLDGAGRGLAMAPRSGTMATPVYDGSARFVVAPGGSHGEALRLPDFPDMRDPGGYRVRLTYIVRERAIGKAGVLLEDRMGWPEGTFTGRLESDELRIIIE